MLHHVEINVTDLGKSTEFWKWLLVDKPSYEISQKWSEGISFKKDGTYLVFVQVEPQFSKSEYHRKHVGLNHLAFHAPSDEFVDEMKQKLVKKGIRILYDSPLSSGESYAIFFEDPDKIKVEISAPKNAYVRIP